MGPHISRATHLMRRGGDGRMDGEVSERRGGDKEVIRSTKREREKPRETEGRE